MLSDLVVCHFPPVEFFTPLLDFCKTCWNFSEPRSPHRIPALGMALRRNCPAVQSTL